MFCDLVYLIALWSLLLNFTQPSMNLVRQARRRQEVGCLLWGRKWLDIQGFWHLLFLLVCMIISPMLFALQQIVGYMYNYNKFKGALCHGLFGKLQYFGGNRTWIDYILMHHSTIDHHGLSFVILLEWAQHECPGSWSPWFSDLLQPLKKN